MTTQRRIGLIPLLSFATATLLLGACGEGKDDDTGDAEADADTDSDTDADTDSDTDSDTDADTDVDAPDLSVLDRPGGCADLVMTFGSTDGSLNLVFSSSSGLAQAAYDDGTSASLTLDLATSGSLVLQQGNRVTDLTCNDAFTGDEVVDTEWTAVSGTLEVEVVTDGVHEDWDAYPGTGTITLEDVVLEADGAESVSVESLSWSAAVGWLPG